MKNTEFNLKNLGSILSSSTSFQALQDLIADFDLELEDALAL